MDKFVRDSMGAGRRERTSRHISKRNDSYGRSRTIDEEAVFGSNSR
jgi:hypothetical protein